MALERLGIVVHPRRELQRALAALEAWTAAHGIALGQVRTPGQDRHVAPPAQADECDLIAALGGDGTTLHALHAAAPAAIPVLGVACGSLGALTATTADALTGALDRVAAGDWARRELAALEVRGQATRHAVNDLVIVRQGASQVSAEVSVDGERYIRFAGDGLVVSTALGSAAYTLAAGGPVLAPSALGLVVTPIAPHGGCCPPLVTGPDATVAVELDPAHGGARVELDGQVRAMVDPHSPQSFSVRLRAGYATLVTLGGEEPLLTGLRRRRILIDSPRLLARDERLTDR